MAAANKNRQNNPLIAFMEEFNISSTDVIIYSACILALILSISIFMFFSKDMVNKQKEYEEITDTLTESESLKIKQAEITRDYENISDMTLDLRNRFMSEKQLNDFKEAIKKLAKEFKSDRIDATEKAESKDMSATIVVRERGREVVRNIIFKKRLVEFTFQMTLGNFVGMLKSLENCNKMIEIPPFRITRGDDDNNIKVTSFVINVYVVPDQLDKDLRTILDEVTFEDYITPINLGEKAQVVPIIEKKQFVREVVKTTAGQLTINPIFKPIKPPPPKPIVPPKELKYMMAIGGGKYVFVFNGDNSKMFIGSAGSTLETKSKEKIPGYDALILKSIDAKGRSFVFEMDEVVGELKR